MLLTIDIGNTNITIGLYQGESLESHWRLATANERMPDEYGLQLVGLLTHAGHTRQELTGICLASVVPPLTGKLVEACRQYLDCAPLVVDTGVKTGVRIRYEDPQSARTVSSTAPQCNVCTAGQPAWLISARAPPSMLSRLKAIIWAGRLPRGSGSGQKPFTSTQLNFRGWISKNPHRLSDATPFTPCSLDCTLGTLQWSRAWLRASGVNWGLK